MSKETIAQQLGITRYPFIIYDDRDLQIYYENLEEDGTRYWARCEYDERGNRTLRENSRGVSSVREYDDHNRRVYYSSESEDHWWRKEFNSVGEVIFYETNTGIHIDNRDE
jgi:hypothetical protein